ncbi:MFS transporter [Alistipes sp. ZOR0009]|jgi:PAT family beta-lactamase induction signal transducer AmpG|uniref:MFS transporter n=1 Tax=Alistipes sp. ZOR0009 TaxID=1339253 RepID=UPI00068CA597|nr:MFS transporter [Alistipes sp. ZOR0009]
MIPSDKTSTAPQHRNGWAWIPTLYFAEGLPYVAVMTIAVIMYKRLGLSNTDIALYTSWLYLPWVIKPFWSPFVDILKTKRWWIITMQGLVAASLASIAFFIPTPFYIQATLAFFWLMAFSSATHDIAADGFYMLAQSVGEQSFFVGIRNTFYRLANIFGQGVLVMFAGALEEGVIHPSSKGNIPLAWSITFYLLAGIFIALTLYHKFILPKPQADLPAKRDDQSAGIFTEFGRTFVSFFNKKNIGVILLFLLTYRLGEAQLVKLASPFLLDTKEAGGLALSTTTVGFTYGTIGVAALLLGGIIGGVLVSRFGLKKWIFPMIIAIHTPNLLFVFLSHYQISTVSTIVSFVALEQFGYGFGFTAYMLYLIHVASGEHKTAHYAIGTGLMALGMMLPGMAAGKIQELIGYTNFFWWVCICTIPSFIAVFLVRKQLDPNFGKKN